MSRNVFQRILDRAQSEGVQPRVEGSVNWFRDTARNTRIKANTFLRDFDKDRFRTKSQVFIGQMICYYYDPKTKNELPYYDKFPLIFIVGLHEKGFYGINFHYLPPKLRAVLMDALWDVRNNNKYDETTKLRISYDILKSASKYKYFKPCLKKYLWSHVKSRFLKIHSNEWDMAIFLPLQQFEKASAQKVYSDSIRKIK